MAKKDLFSTFHTSKVSIKAAQLADAVRDALALPLQQDHPGCILSITNVTLSDDKSRATVWLRFFPAEQGSKTLASATRKRAHYQRILQSKLPRRMVPQISFALDNSIEESAKLDSLLNL